jgi:hypothetical protein
MKVGDSIRKAIDDCAHGDPKAAMLHACNALDGTASKRYPSEGSKARPSQGWLSSGGEVPFPLSLHPARNLDTRDSVSATWTS